MNTVILTGLRSNAELHLGNYLGALLPMVQLQKILSPNQNLMLFVPDLHSFTTPIKHDNLYSETLRNVRLYIAAGINIHSENTLIYRQSFVSAHSELTWILNCFTYFGEAQRMTEFKDKSNKLGHKEVSLGLLDYPVLMAADILLYNAKYIPLGDDQKQHLELARNLAERFNKKFGEIFTVPASWEEQQKFSNREVSVRIRSLSNPNKKMSKSDLDSKGTISLLDDPEIAGQKIMSATTDSIGEIHLDFERQPGISNLLQIGAILSNENIYDYAKKWNNKSNYGELKSEVSKIVTNFLSNFKNEFDKTNETEIQNILENNEKTANELANKTLHIAQKAIGLRK